MRLLIFLSLIFIPVGLFSQVVPSTTQNYISTRSARIPVQDAASFESLNPQEQSAIQVQYFDGIGRLIQTQALRSTPAGNDLISVHEYDAYGREVRSYMPYVAPQGFGAHVSSAVGDQAAFYSADPMQVVQNVPSTDRQFPFAEQVFDASPLNRVLEQGAPGQAWQPLSGTDGHQAFNEHTVVSLNRPNDNTLAIDQVVFWSYEPNTDQFIRPTPYGSAGTYADGELLVSDVKDGNGNQTLTYTDKLGRTILVRSTVDNSTITSDVSTWASTYYLYDDFGQIRFVIQPEGTLQLATQNWDLYSGSVLTNFAFQYKYDLKSRIIEKHIPGAGRIDMVYDIRGKIVLSQDEVQRNKAQPEWSFIKYDSQDRQIITGLYESSDLRSTLQSNLDTHWSSGHYALYEIEAPDGIVNRSSGMHGYSRGLAFPEVNWGTVDIHSVTYYDHYDFDRDDVVDVEETIINETDIPNFLGTRSQRVGGMVTGAKVAILNPDAGMPAWLTTRTYYDKYGREIQTISDNHLGGEDIVSNQYNFSGELLKQVYFHDPGTLPSYKIQQEYALDHRGRVLHVDHQVNSDPPVRIEENTYNELGQVIETNLHSQDMGANFLQSVDYQYHLRGWLTDINQVDPTCAAPASDDFATSIDVHTIELTLVSIGDPHTGGPSLTETVTYRLEDDKDANRFDVSSGSTYAQAANLNRLVKLYNVSNTPGGKGTHPFPNTVTINFSPSENLIQGNYGAITTAIHNMVDTEFPFWSAAERTIMKDLLVLYLHNEYDGIFVDADLLDLFRMKLHYEDGFTALNSAATPQYNGNISGIEWQTAQECAVKGYGFVYDKMNRLTTSYFAEQTAVAGPWSQAVGDYNTIHGYDQNGNILLMTRYGPLSSGNFGLTDQLLYQYSGNRLNKVDETSTSTVASGVDHFIDGTNPGNDYTYDLNGNLTQDLNRDVSMVYNHLNKPTEVNAPSGDKVEYIYAADGTKLRQKVLNNSQTVLKTTDYIGGFQYIQDVGFKVMEHFTHPRGRVMLNGDYQYFLKDHLGNTRIVFGDLNQDGLLNPDPQAGPDVAQIAAYYPFGMRMAGIDNFNASPVNQYLYNGKEVQDELGVNWIDYGARMYDASIGRWNGVDALAEEYISWSPYNYVKGNPIYFIDPDGNSILAYFLDEAGNVIDEIPEAVKNLFLVNYGLEVSYDAKTRLLSYSGEVADNKTPEEVVAYMKEMLHPEKEVAGQAVLFGYELRTQNGSVMYGVNELEGRGSDRGNLAVIDLADFNEDGSQKGMVYDEGLPIGALNIGRVFEHEFFGHGVEGLFDPPLSQYGTKAGDVVNWVNNNFRVHYEFPIRTVYTISRGSLRIIPFSGGKEAKISVSDLRTIKRLGNNDSSNQYNVTMYDIDLIFEKRLKSIGTLTKD